MGSPIEWHFTLRKLINRAEEVALKSQRDVRDLCVDKTRGADPSENSHPLTDRQSYTSGLYLKGRAHEVSRASQSNIPITEINRQSPNRDISGLSSGEIQRDCRSSFQEENFAEWHLLPEATNQIFKRWDVPDIDLFASTESAVVALCIQRLERSVRLLYRRIQSSMEMQTGMGVPTTQPDTQSSPLKQMQRTRIDRGTQVGEDILDVRPRE